MPKKSEVPSLFAPQVAEFPKQTKQTKQKAAPEVREFKHLPNLEGSSSGGDKIPVAAVVSDTHITLAPPSLHRDNTDWEGHIHRNFDWMFDKLSDYGNPPLFVAGDVFDKAFTDPKTILTAMRVFGKYLGRVYAIPGNHDLPYHNIDKMGESSYGVLAHCGLITDISHRPVRWNAGNKTVEAVGYYWQKALDYAPCTETPDVSIAIVHKYVWHEKSGGYFRGCEPHHSDVVVKQFTHPYTFVCFGDNHIPFDVQYGQTAFINCGGFIRRSVVDCNNPTSFTLMYSDGTFERVLIPDAIAKAGERIPTKEEREQITVNPMETEEPMPDFSFLDQVSDIPLTPEQDIQGLYRQFLSLQDVSPAAKFKLRHITAISEF